MLNLFIFEITLLVLCAVLTAVLLAVMWWKIAGERVKALIAGWLALPLLWKIVLPVVFGAFVLHGSVKRGEGGEDFSRVERVDRVDGGEENVANGASVANSNFQFPIGNIGIDNWKHSHNGNILQSSSGQWGMPIVTDEDIARGYWLESVITNAYDYSAIPPTANEYWQWCRRGGYDMYRVQRFGDFAFPYGTNYLTRARVLSGGMIESLPAFAPLAITAAREYAYFVIGQSQFFWWYTSDNEGMVFRWMNILPDKLSQESYDAEIALYSNGDFSTRSNEVAHIYRYINPDDWDDDGLANEIDASPKINDGDFFGIASPLPEGANPQAYYWVELCATGIAKAATIRITCDGASDLGNHVIIARANQVCRVPLLIGAEYALESSSPVEIVAVSSPKVEISNTFARRSGGCRIRYPLDLWFENVGGNLCELNASENVGAVVTNITGGCCMTDIKPLGFRWCCSGNCGCSGGEHEVSGIATWEGYSRWVYSWVWCKCVSETQAGASAQVSFSNDVIIFENEYMNALHDVVSHSSTTNALRIKVNGGAFGGLLEIELNTEGKIGTAGGDVLFSQMEVAAGEQMELEHFFKAYNSSEKEGDIIAKVRFTEFITGAVIEDEDSMTAVRVLISAQVQAPDCKFRGRHKFGVYEKVGCRQYPAEPALSWVAIEGTITDEDPVLYDCFYRCPMYNSERTLKVGKGDVFYVFSIVTVEPSIVIARNVEVKSYGVPENSAGGIGMQFDIYVGPMDVSFSNIYVEEVPSLNGTHSGYFNSLYFQESWSHTVANGAGNWLCVDVRNKSGIDVAALTNSLFRVNDAGLLVDDEKYSWRNGHIEWEVPYGWHTNDLVDCFSPFKIFAEDVRQRFTITSNGTVTIEKFNNSVMRMTNDWQYLNGVRVK